MGNRNLIRRQEASCYMHRCVHGDKVKVLCERSEDDVRKIRGCGWELQVELELKLAKLLQEAALHELNYTVILYTKAS